MRCLLVWKARRMTKGNCADPRASRARAHTHTRTHAHTHTHRHTHTGTHTHRNTHRLSLSLFHSLSHIHKQTQTHTHTGAQRARTHARIHTHNARIPGASPARGTVATPCSVVRVLGRDAPNPLCLCVGNPSRRISDGVKPGKNCSPKPQDQKWLTMVN